MARPDGRIPTRGIQNPIPTRVEIEDDISTSAKQDSQIVLQTQLESLTDTLQELVQRLAPLAGAMNSTAQLRVIQTAVPSTAVTGPITSALSIAEKAVGGISYSQRIALENLTATIANINNAVAA